jgi:Leucine-rich repeat (LRR) protein
LFQEKCQYDSESIVTLEKLEKLDPSRAGYYNDLRSRYIIGRMLGSNTFSDVSINWNNLRLTNIEESFRMLHLKKADLTNNRLESLEFTVHLVSIVELVVKNNNVKSLNGIQDLKFLEILDVSDNQLKSIDACDAVKSVKSLESLQLRGNPMTDDSISHVLTWINNNH